MSYGVQYDNLSAGSTVETVPIWGAATESARSSSLVGVGSPGGIRSVDVELYENAEIYATSSTKYIVH